jgi:branched-chain amino acid transport system substrate-binding protein
MCAEAASTRGLAVRVHPVWEDPPTQGDIGDADAVVYAGVGGSRIASFWETLHGLDPSLWLVGTDGIAVPHLAGELSPPAAQRMRLFVPQRAPFAFYGFEAMTLAHDSIAAGNGDRAEIFRAARATQDRKSLLGTYSLGDDGLTTTAAYGRLAIVSRQLVWDLD